MEEGNVRDDESRDGQQDEGGRPHQRGRDGTGDERPDATTDLDGELSVGVDGGPRLGRVVVGQQ